MNEGKELATLDFANLIGGPLNAVIEAQAKSALTTADFIKSVGFDKDQKVITTDFSYKKEDSSGETKEYTLSVPLLTMLPIPYIEVDEATIEFNANITSTSHSEVSSDIKASVDASASANWWFGKASMKASASYQKKTSATEDIKKTYSMRVFVKARQADMPAGTSKLLSILENAVMETPIGDKKQVENKDKKDKSEKD